MWRTTETLPLPAEHFPTAAQNLGTPTHPPLAARVCRKELHGGARAAVLERMRTADAARGIILLKVSCWLPAAARCLLPAAAAAPAACFVPFSYFAASARQQHTAAWLNPSYHVLLSHQGGDTLPVYATDGEILFR